MKSTARLSAAMRYIYTFFLEEGETIERFMGCRKGKRPKVRHVVRQVLYEKYEVTLTTIAQAEGELTGLPPHHTTVGASIHYVFQHYTSADRAIVEVNRLLEQFEHYWQLNTNRLFQQRLAYYNRIPHHVLAIIITMAEQYGSADKAYNDRLYEEFKNVDAAFFNKELIA